MVAANKGIKIKFVSSDKQRQGIGTKLIQHLMNKLKEAGVNLIYLLTMKDEYVKEFYLKNGFQVSPQIIMMIKSL